MTEEGVSGIVLLKEGLMGEIILLVFVVLAPWVFGLGLIALALHIQIKYYYGDE